MISKLAVVLLCSQLLCTCFGCSRKSDKNDNLDYFVTAKGKKGCNLKTALFKIINKHQTRSYNDVWKMIQTADLDKYYEGDNTILDRYSENPSGSDFFEYSKKVD